MLFFVSKQPRVDFEYQEIPVGEWLTLITSFCQTFWFAPLFPPLRLPLIPLSCSSPSLLPLPVIGEEQPITMVIFE